MARNHDIDPDAFALLGGEDQDDVGERTDLLISPPEVPATETADAILRLAKRLPSLDDIKEVEEGDISPLTGKELEQKARTEEVILAASAADKAAIWVMGQGFANAARGKWFRATHPSLEAYMADLVPHVVTRQARRWVTGSTLALAIADRTGEAPVEGQVRELVQVKGKGSEKRVLPNDLAEDMFVAASTVATAAGQSVTAKVLHGLREQVEELSIIPGAEDERMALLEGLARTQLAGPIGPGSFEGDSNKLTDGSDADDVTDAEIVETPYLDALHQAASSLKEARKATRKHQFEAAAAEGNPDQYQRLVTELRMLVNDIERNVRRAPLPALPVPAQAEHRDSKQPEGAAA